ncbi:MAG: pseudouridine-5'-phosphate glycosidase [Anaerolineaceae bacterium]|nr:pseudouridine-5'-phosphate glycosidase [Anaerolineaceae bacterium]
MINTLAEHLVFYPEVAQALHNHQPIVALESAVITHGLPHPENLNLAREMEVEIRNQGAAPATIALLAGKIHIGLSPEELDNLADPGLKTRKISRRDYGIAISNCEYGGTTVAGTLIAAHAAGIKVFATGGIGGVHRNAAFDVSADLPELSRSPLVVVCAGAKAILDLPATLEYLETIGVPVIGYQTDEFPAFYSSQSGLKVNVRIDNPHQAAQIALAQWDLGLENAILLVQPPPAESAIPFNEINSKIEIALRESQELRISGSAVTPFLLNKVSELSQGSSLRANLALLRNNARLAAKVAKEISGSLQS